MTLRTIRAGELAESLFPRFVDELAERLDDPALDRNETVRDTLRELYGASGGGNSLAAQAVAASFDPRNATLEAEYYRELDPAKWAPVKPLLWFWQMFDHSPVGRNVLLGTRMRAMLARRVFRRCGKNVRIFHECEFSLATTCRSATT